MDENNQDKKQSSSIDKTFIDSVYQEILKHIKAFTPEEIAGAPQTSIKATLLVLIGLIDDLRHLNQVTTTLNTRLCWLTVVLVVLTVILVFLTVVQVVVTLLN